MSESLDDFLKRMKEHPASKSVKRIAWVTGKPIATVERALDNARDYEFNKGKAKRAGADDQGAS